MSHEHTDTVPGGGNQIGMAASLSRAAPTMNQFKREFINSEIYIYGTIDSIIHGLETLYRNTYVTSFPAYSPLLVFRGT